MTLASPPSLHWIGGSASVVLPGLFAFPGALLLPSLPPALMLRRCTLQAASRLATEGQGAALWQTLARPQQWQGTSPAAAVVAPQLVHLQPGSLRCRSELVQHEQQEDGVVYVGPFATAVKRVKVRAAGSAGWHRWCSSPSGHGTIRLPAPDFIFARPSPCPSSHGAESVAVQLRMRAGCGSRHPGAGCCRHHHHRQGVHRGHPGHLWRLHDGPGAPGGQGSVSIRRKRQGWQAGSAWCSVASKRVGARAQPWLPAGRPSTHPSPTRHSKHPLPSSLAPPRAPDRKSVV